MRDRWQDEAARKRTPSTSAKKKVLDIAKEALKANSQAVPARRAALRPRQRGEDQRSGHGPAQPAVVPRTLETKLNDLQPSRLHVAPIDGVKWAARAAGRSQPPIASSTSSATCAQATGRGPEVRQPQQELDGFTSLRRQGLLFDVAYKFRTERQAVALQPGEHRHQRPAARDALHRRGTSRSSSRATIQNYAAAKKNGLLQRQGGRPGPLRGHPAHRDRRRARPSTPSCCCSTSPATTWFRPPCRTKDADSASRTTTSAWPSSRSSRRCRSS